MSYGLLHFKSRTANMKVQLVGDYTISVTQRTVGKFITESKLFLKVYIVHNYSSFSRCL